MRASASERRNVHHRRNYWSISTPSESAPGHGLGREPGPRPRQGNADLYAPASLPPEAHLVSLSMPGYDPRGGVGHSPQGIAAAADAHPTSWVRERSEREGRSSVGPGWTPRFGSDSTRRRPPSVGTIEQTSPEKQGDHDALSAIDATTNKHCDEVAPLLLGSSSSVGFMEEACDALNRRSEGRASVCHSPSVVHVPGERWYREKSLRPTRARHSQSSLGFIGADLSLPPRRVTDHLLQIYWEEIHPLSPLLHEQTFMMR